MSDETDFSGLIVLFEDDTTGDTKRLLQNLLDSMPGVRYAAAVWEPSTREIMEAGREAWVKGIADHLSATRPNSTRGQTEDRPE